MRIEEAPPPSVEQAEEQLRLAREAEKEQAKRAEEERKEHEKQLAALRDEAAGVARAVEDRVADALKFAANHKPKPTRTQRFAAREFLHGQLVPPELMRPQEVLGHVGDAGLNALLGATFCAAAMSADRSLFVSRGSSRGNQVELGWQLAP
jgi:hypothetical protein